jgi:hypothetical protein
MSNHSDYIQSITIGNITIMATMRYCYYNYAYQPCISVAQYNDAKASGANMDKWYHFQDARYPTRSEYRKAMGVATDHNREYFVN